MSDSMDGSNNKVIDSRGSFCPGPLTDLYSAYRESKVGDVIELLATDPAAKSDIQAWCNKSGNQLVEVRQEQGYVRIIVKINTAPK